MQNVELCKNLTSIACTNFVLTMWKCTSTTWSLCMSLLLSSSMMLVSSSVALWVSLPVLSSACNSFLNLFWICLQEFIICMLPFVFIQSLDVSQPLLPFPSLHSLLEDFLFYYCVSKAAKCLELFLHHAHQFCNCAVKLSLSSTVKRTLILLKGADFKLHSSEVQLSLFNFWYKCTVEFKNMCQL